MQTRARLHRRTHRTYRHARQTHMQYRVRDTRHRPAARTYYGTTDTQAHRLHRHARTQTQTRRNAVSPPVTGRHTVSQTCTHTEPGHGRPCQTQGRHHTPTRQLSMPDSRSHHYTRPADTQAHRLTDMQAHRLTNRHAHRLTDTRHRLTDTQACGPHRDSTQDHARTQTHRHARTQSQRHARTQTTQA